MTGPALKSANGLSLLELLITMAITAVLTLSLIYMAMAARSSFKLQEGLAELQENARYFSDLMVLTIAGSGYHPQPWLHESTAIGLMPDTTDGSSANSDRLVTRSWSQRNCFGIPNPLTSDGTMPRFYLQESSLELNNGSLSHSCRHGPSVTELTTQINRQGAIPEVEAFQALFATDTDEDGIADQWLKAGQWEHPGQVLAVRIVMLTRSRESLGITGSRDFNVLDEVFSAPADGRLRRVVSFALSLRGSKP